MNTGKPDFFVINSVFNDNKVTSYDKGAMDDRSNLNLLGNNFRVQFKKTAQLIKLFFLFNCQTTYQKCSRYYK